MTARARRAGVPSGLAEGLRARFPRRALAFFCACLTAAPVLAARPARVDSGLAFAVTLTEGGRSISSDRIAVRIPDTRGVLSVRFDGYDLSGGSFSSPVSLQNDTDADLFGLRIDLVSVAVSNGKSAGGAVPADSGASADPLAWDRLPKGAVSSSLPFRASPVAIPADGQAILLGVVTGVAAVGRFSVNEAPQAASIEVDPGASGDLYVRDAGGTVVRMNAEGRGARTVGKGPSVPHRKSRGPCETRRTADRLCAEGPNGTAWTVEGEEFSVFDGSGALVRAFRPGVGPVIDLAIGKTGRVYLLGRAGAITVLLAF